jgi:hypothetical protein
VPFPYYWQLIRSPFPRYWQLIHSPSPRFCTGASALEAAAPEDGEGDDLGDVDCDIEIMVPAASTALRYSFAAHVVVMAHREHAATMRAAGYGSAATRRHKRPRVGTEGKESE